MYRGRPPPREGYPPPFEGRGPPPPRPYPPLGYRDDRSRPKPPYHSGYHDHGPTDSFRRSPPRRRYPSPGAGDHWAGGPPREGSSPPHWPIPLDHNLVITVGNELTGPPGTAPLSRHHDRDHPPRPEYEQGRSPDRSRAKSRGRSKSRPCSQSRSPDRSRAKSCGRSKSRSPDRSRAKSRCRSKSRSPDRSRAKSRCRSKSRSPDQSRAKSRGRSKSHSPDRSRAKSRGRSKSRVRSKSRSPERSRAKSRGRSKSRPRSRSRSRSISRGRSRGQSYSKAAIHSRSKSRRHRQSHSHSRSHSRSRSRSVSSSSTSGSRSEDNSDEKSKKEFKELQMARRRKELEEMLSLPTKSILKKRNDSEDSPSVRSLDSPRGLEGSTISRVADQLLQAVKGMEPHMVASMLSELRSDPHMAQRPGLDAEIKEILTLLGGSGAKVQMKPVDDIDDEERFLYGDSEEPKPLPVPEPVRHHGLDLYRDVTEDTLYGDYPAPNPTVSQAYSLTLGTAPHLQAPPTMEELDMRYTSRPTLGSDQNITVQVTNPPYPPGTEPLEESERQALEEYEKIQDLLKTIGLDLGVAEISKMAARTKERLHGNKPPPKTPTCRRQHSSGSSDGSHRVHRRRTHSGSCSSSSSSRSCSRGQGDSWSSNDGRRTSPPLKSHIDVKAEQSKAALPPQTPDPSTHKPPQGVPIPTYPPSQVHSMMPPNYPLPNYGPYGNYMPYMHQQWPPVYPPPNMTLPPQTAPEEFPSTLPYKQPYSKPAPEPGVKGPLKSLVQGSEKGSSKVTAHDRVSEEQNNESQKQKVLEEREKLKQEREIRMKKKEYLMKELERLRKQQGELLRKKRREKDGHKDPLLQEISHLQEEVMTQISNLRKEHEAAEKKRREIEKVALILGLSPSDRPRGASKQAEDQEDEPQLPSEKKKREPEKCPEGLMTSSSSFIKQTSTAPISSRASPDKLSIAAPSLTRTPEPFEYYDAGNHWCQNCNVTSGSMFDFFTHLHSKTHRKTLDPYNRPWTSTPTKIIKNVPSEEKLTKPAKGSEFLLPVRGFFCLLCKEFYGDTICAEEHVTTHAHNEKYKKQMYENPLYEQRRNLDRQAGLALETSGKKRKHEDDEKGSKDKEEKCKHKKEKKEKEKKKEADGAIQKEESEVKKEEEGDKLKPSKKDEDFKISKSLDEDKSSYSKKDEDEKHKYSKKDDKYRYSRDEEERGKYGRRDEDDRYSRDEEYRYRYRRDYYDRYDDHSKYGPRDDEDRYKYSKYSNSRSRYDREQDEGKSKAEKEQCKTPEQGKAAGKPEVNKTYPLPKPCDPPKILCGPSPAMRAKLRKHSQEASKPAPAATTASFGKFTWKKKENMLAKEAEKVAAEFIKDDEEAASQQQSVSVEDSFAKSMAVAKEIAQKLAGQPTMTPPWVSNGANRGRIRPNLPAPTVGQRRTATMGKPASLNTFLSIRPQNTSLPEPPSKDYPLFPDPLANTLNAQKTLLETEPVPPFDRCGPFEAKPATPESFEVKLPPPVSTPAPLEVQSVPPVLKPSPVKTRPALSVASELQSLPTLGYCAPMEVNPPASKLSPAEIKPAPSEAKHAQPEMIKIVSDVAAPGVPESEQTRTVFVKPPPFMNMGDGAQKSEKLKSSLAAAKAQDLFGIFYSSISQSRPSSITKPAMNFRADKSPLSTPQAPKPQLQTHSQPPYKVHTQPHPNNLTSNPQTQTHPPTEGHKPESINSPPTTQTHSQLPATVHTQPDSKISPPSAQTQSHLTEIHRPASNNSPPCPQTHSKSQIHIGSVWSLHLTPVSRPEVAISESLSQTVPPNLTPTTQSVPQNLSSNPIFESQITTQTKPAELEATPDSQPKCSPQVHTEVKCDPKPNQDTLSHPDTEPELEPKPGPKTRGKTTPTKKTSPAALPVRQTRSQTRYQTRRQQQQSHSEPEPELTSGDSGLAGSDPEGLNMSDPSSGLQPEVGGPSQEEPQPVEVTPETLGLPSDMTSLNFEYDFNFE